MTNKTIETFLDLSQEEIQLRKDELMRKIPTVPGIDYLLTRTKQFQVQPWPFIIYLAHYNHVALGELLSQYNCYDGTENTQTILEQLREHYILWRTIMELKDDFHNNRNYSPIEQNLF